MIGRQTELRELNEHLHLAGNGGGRIVFLAGDAGVGKTRLLRAFVNQVRTVDGADILQGNCYDEDPAVPYGPFIDALRMLVRTHDLAAVALAAGPWSGD